MEMPSSLPSISGITSPIALRGAGGRRDHVHRGGAGAAQVLVRPVQQRLVAGVGVGGRHEPLLDPEAVHQHLGQRRQAVGRARGVGDDRVGAGVVLTSSLTPMQMVMSGSVAGALMIDLAWRPPSRCLAAPSRFVKKPVDSTTMSTPRSPHGRLAGSRSDSTRSGLPSTTSPSSVDLHGARVAHVDGVVAEQMRRRRRVHQVVDGDDLEVDVARPRGPKDVAADPAEPVDAQPARSYVLPRSLDRK